MGLLKYAVLCHMNIVIVSSSILSCIYKKDKQWGVMRGIWTQKSRTEWLKQCKNVKAFFNLVCNWFSLFQMIHLEIQRKSPAFLRDWDSPGKKKRRKRIQCRGGYLRKIRMMVVNLQFCSVLVTGGQTSSFSYCVLGPVSD